MWEHESNVSELLEGEVGVVVDTLGPRAGLRVMVTNLVEGVSEDGKVVFILDSVDCLELRVDFTCYFFSEGCPTVENVSVLDVEVLVAGGEDY